MKGVQDDSKLFPKLIWAELISIDIYIFAAKDVLKPLTLVFLSLSYLEFVRLNDIEKYRVFFANQN